MTASLDQVGTRVIETAYGVIVDPERMLELVEAWDEAWRTNPEARQGLQAHFETVAEILERLARSETPNLEDSLDALAAPTLAFGRHGARLHANPSACRIYGEALPASLDDLMLEADSEHAARGWLSGAAQDRRGGAPGLTLWRGWRPEADRPVLYEALHSADPDSGARVLIVRVLDVALRDQQAQLMREAFSLSPAECELARALSEGLTLQEIAERGPRSYETLRKQLASLFRKTEVSSQAELMRLLACISRTEPEKPIAPRADWMQPGADEDELALPDGRYLRAAQLGDPDGAPVIYLHGQLWGYRLPEAHVEALRQAGIRLICLVRPGYGASCAGRGQDTLGSVAHDLVLAMDRLGVRRCPVAAHALGAPFAHAMARLHPGRVSALALISGVIPVSEPDQIEALGPLQRAFTLAAKHSPALSSIIESVGAASLRRSGGRAFFERLFRNSPSDMAFIDNPEVAACLEAGSLMSRAGDMRAVMRETRYLGEDWSAFLAPRLTPVLALHGALDPTCRLDWMRRHLRGFPIHTLRVIEGGGQLAPYAEPELFVSTLRDALAAGQPAHLPQTG